jgi:serine/threonine protein kinase
VPPQPTGEPTEQTAPRPTAEAERSTCEHTERLTLTPADLPARPCLDEYEVLAFLGRGSFGHVWKVRQKSTGKVLALKCFDHGTVEGWQALVKEARQLALLDSIHGVIDLKEVGESQAAPHYVMTFAEGGSLALRLEEGRMAVPVARRLFEQVATALSHVHAKGIRHCDLKPGNILLDVRGNALVADFGQAHLGTDAGHALGTLFYMAPEQATLGPQVPDTRWDVYALGAIFYRMVTGKAPHQGETIEQELRRLPDTASRLRRYREWIATAPRPTAHWRVPGMDRELALIIDRCLETAPQRRPHDAGAILEALRRRRHWRRQRPALLAGLVASLLALAITGAAGAWSKTIAVDTYREGLTALQLDSNRQSARLVASAVEQGMNKRMDWLEGVASEANVRTATRTGDRAELVRRLWRALSDNNEGNDLFAEATVASRGGELLAQVRVVPSGKGRTLVAVDPRRYPHRQFSWRDWFSGQGDHAPGTQLPPIKRTHISIPYVSSDPDRPLFLSISVPIRDRDTVVGVLEAAVRLEEMNRWLETANIDTDGFAVLLDAGGHCVLHRDPGHVPTREEGARQVLSPQRRQRQFPRPEGTIESYTDPVDGRSYLVGYARMDRIGWLALVEHDRERVIAPIEKLRSQLGWIGLSTILLVAGLISGVWAWLFWMLRRAEQVGE